MKTITAKQIADLPIDANTILLRATNEKGKEIQGALVVFKYVEGSGYGSSKKWWMHGAINDTVTNGQLVKYLSYEIKRAEDYGYKCRIEIQNYDGNVLPYKLSGHKTTIRKSTTHNVKRA